MSGPFGSSQWMYSSGEAVEGQSLRFNDDDSAYLEWTPASAGDQRTQTISFWVKRANLGTYQYIFSADNTSGGRYAYLRFDTSDKLALYSGNFDSGTQIISLVTTQVFRDVSAWYHVVVTIDITNATAGDRARLYINGERVTDFSTEAYPPATTNEVYYSSTRTHRIGQAGGNLYYCDLYLSEFNFVDGTALGPTSFGETDANGQWVPIKEPSVTYGTNGFYLPFTNDYEVEGFNTVTYIGDGGTQYVGGVGFEPDLVWIKRREGSESHILQDSVRGAARQLFTNTTEAELSGANNVQSFETDGFVVGTDSGSNGSGRSFVAWAWDAGTGSAASNTDGSITSLVKANPDYGFSIVSYTGTGANATVGHGLSSAPEIAIFKNRDTSSDWRVYYHVDGLGSGVRYVALNSTAASVYDPNIWQNTTASNTVLKIGSASQVNGSSNDLIAYCFHSVAGYSDFGNYTGNGSSTGPTVTTGFKPAFLILKRTDGVNSWTIQDNTRDPSNPIDLYLLADDSGAEGTSGLSVDFLSNGFQIKTTSSAVNASGGTYIYMAFADKREAAFWLDQSGNNNDWTNNNMQESDISLDSPLNNFATLNPLARRRDVTTLPTYSEGNLKAVHPNAGGNATYGVGSISVSSGKWYFECYQVNEATNILIGIADRKYDEIVNSLIGYYSDTGDLLRYGTVTATGATYTTGDIIGIAFDLDNSTMTCYKNGVSQGTIAGTWSNTQYPTILIQANTNNAYVLNCGQDSSFAGNKVAQGYQDANGVGDFYYEPPAGYLALCTDNLPDPAIADGSEHFNTVLYTGDGAGTDITGVGFQPDMLWIKSRDIVKEGAIVDAVRGGDVALYTPLTNADEAGKSITFNSDGADLGASWSNANQSGASYVAWNWKAGGSGVKQHRWLYH